MSEQQWVDTDYARTVTDDKIAVEIPDSDEMGKTLNELFSSTRYYDGDTGEVTNGYGEKVDE